MESTFDFVSAKTLAEEPDEAQRQHEYTSECSYRRGYEHGFIQALDMLDAGLTNQQMVDYLNHDLGAWRNADHEGCPNFPPFDEGGFRKEEWRKAKENSK